ncbi:hypothetical protein H4P12_12395 [Paracoccus sp. 11-3]|uniref:Uncharacterized protein n=1 Tax=Paracoccus amoyensis TaxID=2760093 RepID=A0A926J6Q5_9RHOB|nr:hypothetical protein [Paracoccus amoyensis]MBC9247492.1 hypothetical protein [Paracoccus amoyensis]
MTRKALSETASAKADHEQILAGLKSDDWKQRLEEARAKREQVLKQKVTPTAAAIEGLDPTAAETSFLVADRQPSFRKADPPRPDGLRPARKTQPIQAERPTRPMPAVAGMPNRPARRSLSMAGTALGLATLALGGWLWLADSGPVADRQPAGLAPEIAAEMLSPSADPAATADDSRLSFGLVDSDPAQPGNYIIATGAAEPEPAPEPEAVPDAPPTPAELLQRLADVVPAATRVHVPADMEIAYTGDALQLVRSFFAPDRNMVRYFHAADRDLALQSAQIIGAEAMDFTSYAPKPDAGMIEIWLGG